MTFTDVKDVDHCMHANPYGLLGDENSGVGNEASAFAAAAKAAENACSKSKNSVRNKINAQILRKPTRLTFHQPSNEKNLPAVAPAKFWDFEPVPSGDHGEQGHISHDRRDSAFDDIPRITVVHIYVESVERLENGQICTVIEPVYKAFPLHCLAPASSYVREHLKGIPQRTYGGTCRVEAELYLPGDQVDAWILRKVLQYIHKRCLPFEDGYDVLETPQITNFFSKNKMTKDIAFMSEIYRTYLVLGMNDGQLAQQEQLVTNIKSYFTNVRTIQAEVVLYFWRACKDDAVLTWRVMHQVLTTVRDSGVDVERAFGRFFEQEPELRFLWEVLWEYKRQEKTDVYKRWWFLPERSFA